MVVYFPGEIIQFRGKYSTIVLLPKGNNSIQRKVLHNKGIELASLRSLQSPKSLENLAGGTQKSNTCAFWQQLLSALSEDICANTDNTSQNMKWTLGMMECLSKASTLVVQLGAQRWIDQLGSQRWIQLLLELTRRGYPHLHGLKLLTAKYHQNLTLKSWLRISYMQFHSIP